MKKNSWLEEFEFDTKTNKKEFVKLKKLKRARHLKEVK